MLTHNKKGFVLIPVIFKPVKSNISNHIRGISGNLLDALSGVHWRVVIRTLTLQDLPEVKTCGIAFEMPFSNHSGLITLFLQKFWKGLLLPVKPLPIGELSVQMAVFPRENNRPTRSTNRVGDKGTVKKHAILGNTINVRGFIPIGTISRNGLIGMIIGKDEEYIQWLPINKRACGSKD